MSTFSEWLEGDLARDPELRAMVQEESLNADIAIQIYNARTEAGLSQTQLAELVGTSQSTIARLEDADYEGHSVSMLKRITSALNKELRVAITDASPSLDLELRHGGRLRDYMPVVRFSAERIAATFPKQLDANHMLRPGLVGVIDADTEYRRRRNMAFESFAIPFIRAAMLTEVQSLSTTNQLRAKTSRHPLQFTDLVKDFSKEFSISRKTIKETIVDFSQFQFVRLPAGKEEREVLLFTRLFRESGQCIAYLVVAHQTDHVLSVSEAYRIRRNLANDVFQLPPLEVLKALVDRFGLYISVGDTTQKFILSEQIPVKGNTKIVELARLGDPPSCYMSAMVRVTSKPSGRIAHCALAYCIDHDKYREWAMSGK